MRILHLTDFHYQSGDKNKYEQDNLVAALTSKLENEPKIDCLVFSGDLVNSGAKITDFEKAKALLIDGILNQTIIPRSNVFICGGNHDVWQDHELKPITEALNKIKSNEELEQFIKDQSGKSFGLSLVGLKNFICFEKKFYTDHGLPGIDFLKDLY